MLGRLDFDFNAAQFIVPCSLMLKIQYTITIIRMPLGQYSVCTVLGAYSVNGLTYKSCLLASSNRHSVRPFVTLLQMFLIDSALI